MTSNSRKVLVVEDDPGLQTQLKWCFEGYEVLIAGDRATAGAPPRIPHRLLMRENCVACHDGPAAREEIRTDHPERDRCRQCHVPVETRSTFESAAEPSPDS